MDLAGHLLVIDRPAVTKGRDALVDLLGWHVQMEYEDRLLVHDIEPYPMDSDLLGPAIRNNDHVTHVVLLRQWIFLWSLKKW
jgi:hypothetical protein